MKQRFSGVGALVAVFLFWGLWINGCIHSNSKHKDDSWAMSQSPLAIYRGAEFFWHDDFADVDWSKRLKNDVETVCYFIEMSAENVKVDEMKMEVENFSKKISKYPKDKIFVLKNAGRKFINYFDYMASDMALYVDSLIAGADVNPSKWDMHPKYFEDSLQKEFDLKSRVDKGVLDSMAISMRINWGFGGNDKVKEFSNYLKKQTPSILETYKDAYYRIFNEHL